MDQPAEEAEGAVLALPLVEGRVQRLPQPRGLRPAAPAEGAPPCRLWRVSGAAPRGNLAPRPEGAATRSRSLARSMLAHGLPTPVPIAPGGLHTSTARWLLPAPAPACDRPVGVGGAGRAVPRHGGARRPAHWWMASL